MTSVIADRKAGSAASRASSQAIRRHGAQTTLQPGDRREKPRGVECETEHRAPLHFRHEITGLQWRYWSYEIDPVDTGPQPVSDFQCDPGAR